MKGKKSIPFKKVLKPEMAMRWAATAEKLNFRRKGTPIWNIKKDGFNEEYTPNTNGFCALVDFLYLAYISREETQSSKIPLLREKIFDIEKQLKELGIWDIMKPKVQALEEEVKKL